MATGESGAAGMHARFLVVKAIKSDIDRVTTPPRQLVVMNVKSQMEETMP